MIDLDSVKERADLLALASRITDLKKVAGSGGGEWAGPCPFCGGRDRFRVQPFANPGRWLCRSCTEGKWDSAIGFIARRDQLDPKKYEDLAEICRRATGELPTTPERRQAPEIPAYTPPAEDWQAEAYQVIDVCRRNLWADPGCKALGYLKDRGLSENTIVKFNLGYSTGFQGGNLWVPRGILIPCVVRSTVWYLKIRLPARPGGKKYDQVKGSRSAAIYNADELVGADAALFCEGEFDAMIATQELGELLPCATFGAAKNRPDLATWGSYLRPLRLVLSSYDADQAGESGALILSDLCGSRVKLAPVDPPHKDINDFYLAGGDLQAWISSYLAFYDPQPGGMIDTATTQLGGVVVSESIEKV